MAKGHRCGEVSASIFGSPKAVPCRAMVACGMKRADPRLAEQLVSHAPHVLTVQDTLHPSEASQPHPPSGDRKPGLSVMVWIGVCWHMCCQESKAWPFTSACYFIGFFVALQCPLLKLFIPFKIRVSKWHSASLHELIAPTCHVKGRRWEQPKFWAILLFQKPRQFGKAGVQLHIVICNLLPDHVYGWWWCFSILYGPFYKFWKGMGDSIFIWCIFRDSLVSLVSCHKGPGAVRDWWFGGLYIYFFAT